MQCRSVGRGGQTTDTHWGDQKSEHDDETDGSESQDQDTASVSEGSVGSRDQVTMGDSGYGCVCGQFWKTSKWANNSNDGNIGNNEAIILQNRSENVLKLVRKWSE